MNKCKNYIIMFLMILTVAFTISTIQSYTMESLLMADSPFGSNVIEDNGSSGGDLKSRAEASGKKAQTYVAEFKNVEALNNQLAKVSSYARWFVVFIASTGTITSILVLAMAFIRMANAPASAFQRREVYFDIGKGLLSTVLFGGLTLIMTVFYKTFQTFINKTIMISNDWKAAFGYALIEYKFLISGICGLLSLTMLVIFIKDCLMLGATGTNPQKRAEAIKKICITGAATVGLGGTGLFVAIFNGLLV